MVERFDGWKITVEEAVDGVVKRGGFGEGETIGYSQKSFQDAQERKVQLDLKRQREVRAEVKKRRMSVELFLHFELLEGKHVDR
jgi:hypothetical protein